jgi:hypothetical protein
MAASELCEMLKLTLVDKIASKEENDEKYVNNSKL